MKFYPLSLIMMKNTCNILEMKSSCFIRNLKNFEILKIVYIHFFQILISKFNFNFTDLVWHIIEVDSYWRLMMSLL